MTLLTSHGWVEQNSPWLRKTFLTPVVNIVKERQEGSGSSQPTTVRRAAETDSWLDNIHFISYVDRWLTSTVGKWKWGSFEEGINHHSSIFWWWSNYMLELLWTRALCSRNQCLPPDVWGPTQMLNINIIQCNWTSVIKYTELRASGELTCSTLLQMDWEWQRGNLISWMSTKLPTALALCIYLSR